MEVEWQQVKFKDDELKEIKETFAEFDADGNGSVTVDELKTLFARVGEPVPGYQLREMIEEVDTDKSGTIEFEEFINMMKKVRASGGRAAGTLYRVAGKAKSLRKMSGTSAASSVDTAHSYSEEETIAFADWINYALGEDADLKDKLPIPTENFEGAEKLFKKVKDGLVLAKLINTAVPDTIDERTLNKGKLNTFNIGENQTLVVNSAAAIGVNITNIGPNDLMDGTPHIVLGMLWQIIRIGLFAKINIREVPGLSRLLHDGEELADLLALSPEELLLRWVNFHLENAGCARRIKNFSGDIKDSEAYVYLLTQIAPRDLGVDTSAMSATDLETRAEMMLANAEKMDCNKFVKPRDIVHGNPKLNLAFVANLFNHFPGLEADEAALADWDLDDVAGETREERTFRNWMNSLGVSPFVHRLYSDLSDGLILLQLIDRVRPGIVDWAKVNKPPFKKIGAHMKKIENCNYAVDRGLALKFSLVGIAGSDIYACNKTLTLGFVWQLMRAYTLKLLSEISEDGGKISDQDIVDYANERLKAAGKQTISGFKDPYISTSRPILHLVDSIKPGTVKWDDVTDAGTEEDKLANAKLAVSLSRKIGAGVYALPEDIVEVKPKMLLTIFACLQVRALKGK